ncbi:ligand-binding sensor domain-containing protein [Clostridium gasigenes]|uniref:ligand-binding sensor domain-containing protein n=1 Tax=Clostridium gasigenes TaxID=94869 RepID=UPI001C0DDFC1|nr:sensor histidine kinase [Clostridium gasigenes]MBU3103829.1 histidine kinase [Clostridium gasigenes]
MKNQIKGVTLKVLVILFLILLQPVTVKGISTKDTNMTFKRITIEDGLSQTSIEYLYQDTEGYMWIGTADGLNRYNGHEFEIYRYKEGAKRTIAANYISAIKEDKTGDLWIGTSKGLNKINQDTKEISTYLPGENGEGISHYNICEILVDSKGDVFVATENGLNIYNRETDSFKRILNSNELTSQFIYSIAEDEKGRYWIGTDNGLNMYNKETGEVKQFLHDKDNENTISSNAIFKLYMDKDNKLFVGTIDKGLSILDTESYDVIRYLKDPKNKSSIPGNFVKAILRDSRGMIWIGTDDGFAKFDEKEKEFKLYESKTYDSQSIVNENILSLCEDKSGTIWVGTYGGISLFNPGNIFSLYKNDPYDDNSISEASVQGIYEDNEGLLWVGTTHNGINSLDRKNNIIKRYANESGNEKSLIYNNIKTVVGIDNEIWIATENGLSKFDKNTNEFTNYKSTGDKNSLPNDVVRTLHIDSEGILWIGTRDGLASFDRKDTFVNYKDLFEANGIREYMFSDIYEDKDGIMWFGSAIDGGLIKYNKETGKIKNYKNNKADKNSLSFNSIKSINEDSTGNLWIATHYGINKFNKETEKFTRYTEEDGLSNDFTYGILIDENDDVWVSSNYGISKYDIKKNKFINFNVTDGLQGNEFNAYSYFESKSGEMFFGGINGITSFYPKNLIEKTFIPPVIIESITIKGEVKFNLKEDIVANHRDNNVYINFFMPDYRNKSKIQYAYKLRGLDKEWIFSENRNYASYTNLAPGSYEFFVKGRNSSGEWSDAVSIKIKINNPFWKTPIAYILYLLLAIIGIILVLNRMKWLDRLVKQKTFELNNKLEENELLYAKLIRTERYKNNYFVNLSHELRTPLNVILSTQQLITNLNTNNKPISKGKLDYYMLTLNRNSNRLLNLINNIIDTSKIESGAYRLNIKKVDIVYLVEEAVLSMKDFVEDKGIGLIIDPEMEEKIIDCDDSEIEKCVINLIANATKFTPDGGEIKVEILDLGDMVKIIVKDTGIGIEKKYHESIFNRFDQVYDKISEEHGGSGLGLTLTKQLVNLHNGQISVESICGEGSTFIIILPIKQR